MALMYQDNADAVYGSGEKEVLVRLLPVPTSAGDQEIPDMSEAEVEVTSSNE
jgi:hypothetical protein